MIKEIKLKNFKRHENLVLPINDGVTALTGKNTSGKTTVLKAVLFALFGSSAAGAKDHLWRWGADGGKSVTLSIDLPSTGLVEITRSPSGAKATDATGRVVASGSAPVTKLVEESFGMSAKDLRTICYSPQGEARGILTMGPTALQRKVEELARMEVLDKVLDMLGADIGRLEGSLAALADTSELGALEAAELGLEEDARQLGAAMESTEYEILCLETEARDAAAELEEARIRKAEREGLQRELDMYQHECARMAATLEALGARLEQLPEAARVKAVEVRDALKAIEAAIRLSEEAIRVEREATERKESLAAQVEDLEKRVAAHDEADRAAAALRFKLDNAVNTWKDIVDEKTKAASELTRLKDVRDNSVCPTCGQATCEVDEEALGGQIAEYESKLEMWTNAEVSWRKTKMQAEADLKAVERRLDHGAKALLDDRRKALEALMAFPRAGIEKLEADLARDKGVMYDLNSQMAYWSRQADERDAALRSKETLQADLDRFTPKAAAAAEALFEKPPLDIEGPAVRLDEAGRLKAAAVAKFKELADLARKNDADLSATRNRLMTLRTAKAEAERLNKEAAQTKALQSYLRKNRQRLGQDLWGGLLAYASALASSATNGRLSSLERGTDGGFTVEQDGARVPVDDDCLSGSQLSIVGMALRVALNRVFYAGKSFLMLDEPTADADPATAAAIAGMLRSLNTQVITISHNHHGEAVNADEIIQL